MLVDGKSYRTIWPNADGSVSIIDQTRLPHSFEVVTLHAMPEAAHAIKTMVVRGAPLIGATAAYGMALAMQSDPSDASLATAYDTLHATRPTAVNLHWALDDARTRLSALPPAERAASAWARAAEVCDEDVALCEAIGDNGLSLIQAAAAKKKPGETVNILTHCNAGWLATVDWGTAIAPIYKAFDAGCPSMSGSMKPGRAIRVPGSRHGNWVATVCRTRSSSTTPVGISCSTAWSIWSSPAPTAPRPMAMSATRSALISKP